MEQDKIVIEHLNLWYGSFQALKDINLRLPANEITAFIGPSGCGKSTLLKSLNRMNDLVEGCRIEGTVTLDGEDIFSRKMDVNLLRKRVGMVFQKPNPFPMSIYDNVAYLHFVAHTIVQKNYKLYLSQYPVLSQYRYFLL